MSASFQPPGGDENRGPALIAIFWVEIAISTAFIVLRLFTRWRLARLGAEDWTILATLVMYITTLSLCTVLVHYGLGRHIYYVPIEHQQNLNRWNWIVQPFGILTLPIGKISVVLLLQRLMGPTAVFRKWFLWINMVAFTASMVASSILSFAQCNPPRALWEDVPGSTCLDPSIQAHFAEFTCAYSSFLDFVLALIPITFIRHLKMSLQKKVGLCVLLGMGVLSGVCAAIKTVQSSDLGVREDVSWELYSLYAWSSSEIFLNIVCACIPTLKPLYDHFAFNRPLRPDHDSASHDRHHRFKTARMQSFRLDGMPKRSGNSHYTDESGLQTVSSVQAVGTSPWEPEH
ncbi:hypothetical protein F4778DRAFT_739113 [Xylariomycetidae sp. FL2044]|nr:hypothetical protein F4778DRAFT_739113 [Xylariomycetidae sp. FL2044]